MNIKRFSAFVAAMFLTTESGIKLQGKHRQFRIVEDELTPFKKVKNTQKTSTTF